MADATKFKYLFEAQKKMDQKLQYHECRRDSIEDRLQEKIHVVGSPISGMGVGFNDQLQGMNNNLSVTLASIQLQLSNLCKGKYVVEEESILCNAATITNGVSYSRNPQQFDSSGTVGQQGNQFIHSIPKVDFPKFDGSDPTSWFLRYSNYFKSVPNFTDAQKINMACMNLEVKAEQWHKSSRMGQTELSWPQFVEIISARFESIKGTKIVVELSKLKHTCSYDDYVDKFEELKDHLMLFNQARYTEDYFIASFISGVYEDMQVTINFVEPRTLRQTIELGRKHLLSMEAITRELKAPVSMERNQETEMEDILLEFQDVLEKPTEFLPTNSVPEHQFLYRASQKHNDENERIQKEGIEMVYTPKMFDTLVERSFDSGGRHAFDVVFQSEMQVICVTELVETKLEIGVEENEVDENLSDRLIEGEQNWTYQDLWKPVSVNFSSRDRSVLFDEFKVLDKILQVQESAISVKQWEMMCFDFCLGGFKSKVGADFISLRPLPKPPPMLKFYNGNSVVLKRREESVNIQRLKLVPPVKEKTEESQMLSVLQAKESSIWDSEGNRYIVNQRHSHPKIMQALVEERLTLNSRAFYNDKFSVFAECVTNVFRYGMVLPMNTSEEGVETAVTMARKWGYLKKGISRDKATIVSCCGCFHRRTLAVISMSCDNEAMRSFWPLLPGYLKFEFGDSAVFDKIFKEEVDEIVMRRSGCNVDLLASQSNLNLSNASIRVYHTTATWRNGSGTWIEVGYCEIYITTGDLDFGYVQRDIDQWWSWTKIGIGFYGWCLGIADAYNFYLGGGALDVSLLTTEEGILEVNDLLLLVVVEVVRCMWLDKMSDRPPPKPPFQFRHLSLGDKTQMS